MQAESGHFWHIPYSMKYAKFQSKLRDNTKHGGDNDCLHTIRTDSLQCLCVLKWYHCERGLNSNPNLRNARTKRKPLKTVFLIIVVYVCKLYYLGIDALSVFQSPRPLGPKEIDGLPVPPGKAYMPLIGLATGQPLCFEPAQKCLFGLLGWLYFKHLLDVMTSSIW